MKQNTVSGTINEMQDTRESCQRPKRRSALRIKLDTTYWALRRYALWAKMHRQFSV